MSKDKTVAKRSQITAFIYPTAGVPYTAEVEPDDEGRFTVNENTWVIQERSVSFIKKRPHVICHEGNPLTVTSDTLAGKAFMTASMFHRYIKNNRLTQLFNLLNSKAWYQRGETWLLIGVLGIAVLVLVWMVTAIDGGLESLADSISRLRLAGSGANSGHNQIGA